MEIKYLLMATVFLASCAGQNNREDVGEVEPQHCNGLKEVVTHYASGKIKEKFYLNCEDQKDSLYTSYFKSGRIEYQGLYENGRKHGEWLDNYRGKNRALGVLPNTYTISLYRNDTLLEQYYHESNQYDTTCTAAKTYLKYDETVLKQTRRFHDCSDILSAETFWVDDWPDSIHRRWNEKGQLYQIRYHENFKATTWIDYDPLDTTQLLTIQYFDNDQLTKIEHYKNNKVVRIEYPEE